VAFRKAQSLLAAGARLVIVAEDIDDMFTTLGRATKVRLIKGRYSKEYLVGASLVIAATNNPPLNRQIYKDCQELEVLCNVVDDVELCDFFTPAVVKRGDLQIAIGTGGDCPVYAGHIRSKLEKIFTEEHGQFLAELQQVRRQVLADIPDAEQRKTLLGQLADDESLEYFIKNGPGAWRHRAEKIIKEYPDNPLKN